MATKNEIMIQFNDVKKDYKEVKALDGISFEILKGDIFGYIGPNGAGKTTTLKILVGLIKDFSGEVLIQGNDILKSDSSANLIGYLPQEVGFQEWRTVEHALTTFGRLSGIRNEELEIKIQEILKLVELLEARKRKIKHLSGGMKQKLLLAQALLHNPKILVLDEPMSGLDPTSRWQMKNIMMKLAEMDITIIFSSHILRDVEDFAKTIAIINKGKIIKIGKPKELQEELTKGDTIELIGNNLERYTEIIKKIPNVLEVNSSSNNQNKISIVFNQEINKDEAILILLEKLVENKIVINNLNYLEPSLEEVYLKYVSEGGTAK